MNIEISQELIEYLGNEHEISASEITEVRPLTGGVSNRTMLVRRISGESWVIKQALDKLRVEVDWRCAPERIHRESLGLRWLERLLPTGAVPRFVFEDHEHHLMAMTEVVPPHENWKTILLSQPPNIAHMLQSAELLSAIHAGSTHHAKQLGQTFADVSFFEALRLEPYYCFTADQVPSAAAFLRELVADTRRHCLALVHGDFSPKNILVQNDKLVLLDHEVIHWGDPAFDCGFFLAHIISKSHHVRRYRSLFADAARTWWNGYWSKISEQAWATDSERRVVRNTLGCLLARVRGRSPLEYLDAAQRSTQERAVLALMTRAPADVESLVDECLDAFGDGE